MKRRMFPGIVRNDNPGFLWYDGENVHENAYVLGKGAAGSGKSV